VSSSRGVISTLDRPFELVVLTDTITDLVLPNGSSNENAEFVAFLFKAWLALLADSPYRTESHGGKSHRVYTRFRNQLLATPLRVTVSRYSDLADRLLASCHQYGLGSTTGDYIPEMQKTPIYQEYLQWYKQGDPELLRYILTFLWFIKKAEFIDEELAAAALRGWLEVEDKLTSLVLPTDVTDQLATLATHLLQPVPVLPFMGKHGPGTVAGGGRSPVAKTHKLQWNPLLDRAFFLSVGHSARQEREAYDIQSVIPQWESWIEARMRRQAHGRIVSELLFVPKTVKSMRSICREPATQMYFQQAVLYELVEMINNSELKKSIDFSDQQLSADLCKIGSATGLIDTIDLSAASDSVHVDLVKRVFPQHLLPRLLATRTKFVELPDGEIREVQKFAPMGSAVCFPVQSILYTLIVLRSHLEYVYGPNWFTEVVDARHLTQMIRHATAQPGVYSRTKLQPIRVYGDDIMCDSRITPDVIHTLVDLGFQVNTSKSFTSSQAVRESCGMYAWCGEDIVPTIARLRHFSKTHTARSLASLVDYANRLGDVGYRHTQRCMIHEALRRPIQGVPFQWYKGERLNPIPFVTNREHFGIFTLRNATDTNKHLKVRDYDPALDTANWSAEDWKKNSHQALQRREARCISWYQKRSSTSEDWVMNRFNHTMWWRSAYHRESVSEFNTQTPWYDTLKGREFRWGWTPT
jgi:hypothetical protein